MFLAHRWFTGKIPKGQVPPDICVHLALWDKFSWSPEDTKAFTWFGLRLLFMTLEQQRVAKDYRENIGSPDPERLERKAWEDFRRQHGAGPSSAGEF